MTDWNHIANKVESLLKQQKGLLTTFTYNGKPYEGTKTVLRREDWETDAGLVDGGYSFSILCPTAQFNGAFPVPRTGKVLIGKQEYRILSIDADAIGATIKINCGNVLL
jgi:hypothetical protein